MQAALVMAFALTGLGCQNKEEVVAEPLPVYTTTTSAEPNPYPRYTTPSSYSGYYQRNENTDISDVYPNHWEVLRATICSFVIGRDPDVITVNEIEASVYGDSGGH